MVNLSNKKVKIAIFGGRKAAESLCHEADLVGRGIAERGWVLLCGGRGGIMEAVSRACREAGGTVIGILPGEDDSDANPWVDITIPTGIGFARNAILAAACNAAVAIGGHYGTLSEIAYALHYQKPLIQLNSWNIPGSIPAENAADVLQKLDVLINKKESL
ncbi:MAG: TIGR00725 family protein [Candidatus Neomarinimicrobiota bacterium]